MCGHGQQSGQCQKFDVHGGGGLSGCRMAAPSATIQGTTVTASSTLPCVKSSDEREREREEGRWGEGEGVPLSQEGGGSQHEGRGGERKGGRGGEATASQQRLPRL